MRLVMKSMDVEVSLSKVTESKLVDEPLIVELANDFQRICEVCPTFKDTNGHCPVFPFCHSIRVRQLTVPKYPTGEVTKNEKGESVPVYREGEPCEAYGRPKFLVDMNSKALKRVYDADYKGFEVLEDGEGVKVEERAAATSGTDRLEIREEDLYPTGVEDNFLVEGTYEVYAKAQKDSSKTLRATRQLYEMAVEMLKAGRIAIKTGFVWKAGTYTDWAVLLEPMVLDNGKFVVVMKTTGARLEWQHAMEIPPADVLTEQPLSKAPKVNNLKAVTSFLDGMKQQEKQKPVTSLAVKVQV